MKSNGLWHSDAFGRVVEVGTEDQEQEMYLSPVDGRLTPLFVQGTSGGSFEPGGTEATGRWQRCGPAAMRVSLVLRLVHWTYSSMVVLKWIPACLLLLPMLLWPQSLEGTLRSNGNYDQVCAFDRKYPRVARNHKENRSSNEDDGIVHEPGPEEEYLQPLLFEGDIELTPISHNSAAPAADHSDTFEDINDAYDALLPRHFGPRFLCFLQYDTHGNVSGCETRLVADWMLEHGDDSDIDFVFLSYTRKQFCVATLEELTNWNVDVATREALFHIAPKDREMLRQYGIEAALSAGKSAFWLDFECIRDADGLSKATSQSYDVYRICDIVRAAHSLAILVGPPLQSRYSPDTNEPYSPEAVVRWLQEWGTRLWTLPEILLISSEKRVKIYAVDGPRPPLEWSKRHFASRSIWRDAKLVRQLIDHYESSIHLKPLELISIALDCFTRRSTDQFNQADIVYALMGLLRRRPAINKSDTSFIAFARLSLLNDTESLLERLICLQPLRAGLPWYDQGDYWSAKLWDIEPVCQVAGIIDDGTVTLDGAYGATIQWDSMEQIYFFKRPTFLRNVAKILLRGAPVYFIFGLSLTIAGAVTRLNGAATLGLLIPGVVVLIPTVLILLSAPALLYHIYDGKFWSTQALFVGMEGVPSTLGFVEERLFGSDRGRLRWSVAGSRLSRHELSPDGECVGLPPLMEDNVPESSDQLPVFTLVDTYSMTATAFRSARPPTAVVVFGREGGMQRAALCSYDWKRNTFAREQVVRLKTTVLDRMPRMDRFRFSLERRRGPPEPGMAHGIVPTQHPREPISKLRVASEMGGNGFEKWTTDLVLLPCMFIIFGQMGWVGGGAHLAPLLYFVGFFLVQPFVPMAFRRLPVSQITGWAGLLASAIWMSEPITIMRGYFVSDGAGLALRLLSGVAEGLLSSSFIFLTYSWYGPTSAGALRLLFWCCGLPFFTGLAWTMPDYVTYSLAMAIITALLSLYSFFFLGTPDQVDWKYPRDRARYMSWQSTAQATQQRTLRRLLGSLSEMSRRPQTWLFFSLSFLSAGLAVFQILPVSKTEGFLTLALFPTLLLLAAGIVFQRAPVLRVPIIILFVSTTFALALSSDEYGLIELALFGDGYGRVAAPKDFLSVMFPSMAQFLVWALLITESRDPAWQLETLAATMGGYAAGRIVLIAVRGWQMVRCDVLDQHCSDDEWWYFWTQEGRTGYLSAVFALEIVVLLAWGVYKWKGARRRRGDREEGLQPVPMASITE